MIIKKWSGSAWVNQTVRTTASDIFTDNTFTTSIFENGKVKPAYLPNEVFDSLHFVDAIGQAMGVSTFDLGQLARDGIVGAGTQTTGTRGAKGSYWVADGAYTITESGSSFNDGGVYYQGYFSAGDGIVGAAAQGGAAGTVVLETGDWIILTNITGAGTSLTPYIVTFATVNNTYETATATVHGIVKLFNATPQSTAANAVSTTASRTYGIQNNAAGQLVVNVPWSDTNTTYTAGTGLSLTGTTFANTAPDQTVALTGAGATTISGTYPNFTISSVDTTYGEASPTTLGLVRTSFTALQGDPTVTESTGASRYYGISANSSGELVVNVPWTDTVYSLPQATTSALGGVKLGVAAAAATVQGASTTAGRFYHVGATTAGNMYVNVPWVDTNTTYSAGNGISLSTTTFSVAAGVGLTQEASGLKMTQPFISSATAPAASFQVVDNLWFDIA
jgi:hypothetical protein